MKLSSATLLLLLFVPAGITTAAPMSFTGNLNGPNESPVNASLGTGFTRVTIDDVLNTMRVEVQFSGLTSGVTASHIHVINGPGDANTSDTLGPVATTTPTFTGFPSAVTFGTFDSTFDMTLAGSYRAGFITDAGGIAAARAALFAGIVDGRAYLNIHTTTSPSGEIRSFLTPEIPEPGTVGIVGAGLALLAGIRRRKQMAA